MDLLIGGKVRKLKMTTNALAVAQKLMGGEPQIKLAVDNGPVHIAMGIAAACLGGGDEKVSFQRVAAWLDAEPSRHDEFAVACLQVFHEYYAARNLAHPLGGDPKGEAQPPSEP